MLQFLYCEIFGDLACIAFKSQSCIVCFSHAPPSLQQMPGDADDRHVAVVGAHRRQFVCVGRSPSRGVEDLHALGKRQPALVARRMTNSKTMHSLESGGVGRDANRMLQLRDDHIDEYFAIQAAEHGLGRIERCHSRNTCSPARRRRTNCNTHMSRGTYSVRARCHYSYSWNFSLLIADARVSVFTLPIAKSP